MNIKAINSSKSVIKFAPIDVNDNAELYNQIVFWNKHECELVAVNKGKTTFPFTVCNKFW